MSLAAQHQSRGVYLQCEACRERKARFRFRGHVKADRDHTLCFACYRAERDRRRAQLLAEVPPATQARAPLRSLTKREVEHRGEMLAHLSRRG